MNEQQLIGVGKSQFQLLLGLISLLTLGNTVLEIGWGFSYALLVYQGVLAIGLTALCTAVWKGQKLKNLLFAVLFLTGVSAFYQAGTRMPDLRSQEIGMLPVLTLCIGFGYILCGIYLSYSEEIGAFLRSRVFDRQSTLAKNI